MQLQLGDRILGRTSWMAGDRDARTQPLEARRTTFAWSPWSNLVWPRSA